VAAGGVRRWGAARVESRLDSGRPRALFGRSWRAAGELVDSGMKPTEQRPKLVLKYHAKPLDK